MTERIAAAMLCLVILCALTACNIKQNEPPVSTTRAALTTKPEEFVDNIPEFEFANYVDSVSKDGEYRFNVECSRQEYDAYYALVLQCGYNLDAVSYTDQYSARNRNGYSVNMSFSGTELFVIFKLVPETIG